MLRRCQGLVFVVMGVSVGCTRSPSSPSSSQRCRTYRTAYSTDRVTSSGTQHYSTICHFDLPTNHLLCSFDTRAYSTGTFYYDYAYGSRQDFIDETAVNPPRTLYNTLTTTQVLSSSFVSLFTYVYDGNRRPLSGGGPTYSPITFSDWDDVGRPLASTTRLTTGDLVQSYRYNPATRELVIEGRRAGNVTSTDVYVYDLFGQQTYHQSLNDRSVVTVTSREDVCSE